VVEAAGVELSSVAGDQLVHDKTHGPVESGEMLEAVMVQYGPYEYSDNEVLKLTEYLKNCARQREVRL
jgi:hypothetical protein